MRDLDEPGGDQEYIDLRKLALRAAARALPRGDEATSGGRRKARLHERGGRSLPISSHDVGGLSVEEIAKEGRELPADLADLVPAVDVGGHDGDGAPRKLRYIDDGGDAAAGGRVAP